MVAKAPGSHYTALKPDYSSQLHLINCQMERRFPSVYKVPVSMTKLEFSKSHSPICMDEKRIQLLDEILDIFVMENGTVLYAYGQSLPLQ